MHDVYPSTKKLTAGAILSLSTHCDQLPLGAGGITLPEGEGAKVPDMLEKWLEEKPYAETLNLRGAGNIPGQLAVRLLLELPMLRDAGLELSACPAEWVRRGGVTMVPRETGSAGFARLSLACMRGCLDLSKFRLGQTGAQQLAAQLPR